MSKVMIDAQGVFIGMLAVFPDLFPAVVVEPKYLDLKYRCIFIAMLRSMEEHNALVLEKLFLTSGFDSQLYMECTDSAYTQNRDYFKNIQDVIISDYKRTEIKVLSDRLYANEITLEEYGTLYQGIMAIGFKNANVITYDVLKNSCLSTESDIKFTKFRRTGSALRMEEHDFMILAAGTGIGKTGAALNLAIDLCRDYQIMYFNLEMTENKMYRRLLSIVSEISQDEIKKYEKLSDDKKNKLEVSMKTLDQPRMKIIHDNQSIESIRAYLSINNNGKHSIVFIDHIGLITSKARNSYERATENAKELRKFSKEFNCTIIGLSQLNRDAMKKDKGKKKAGPELSMLRDSGEVEQSARKVMFLWEDNNEYEFAIVKNDSGPKGKVKVVYDKATQTIYESAYQR